MTVASSVAEERARGGRAPASSPPRTLAFAGLLVAAAMVLSCGEEVTTPLPQVTVSAVTPTEGPLAGGTPITIQGTNFSDVIEVTIGGVDLDYFLVRSTTEITGLVGAVPDVGPTDVVVTSRTHGTGTCEGCFSYYDPRISVTAVSPDTGNVGKSVPVTITGTGFVDVTSVMVGGVELEDRMVVSSVEITGTLPAHADPGVENVVVTSSRTGERTCEGCFRYLLDVVTQRVAAGRWHSCALATSGAAYCWGDNGNGALGDGSNTDRTTPVPVVGDLEFRTIAAGQFFTCGLSRSGKAYCWGMNAVGELGDGSFAYSNIPVQVDGSLEFSIVSGEKHFACGLTRTGAVYCWGSNWLGQFGSGASEGLETPSPIPGGGKRTFSTLTTGFHHACGLTPAGVAYCWGWNSNGQLGDGTLVDRDTPVAVSGGLTFSRISAGSSHTCALGDVGTAYCWGNNITAPVAMSNDLQFSAISAGSFHTCGISTSETAYCWGDNLDGQLGDGSTTDRGTPVPVSGNLRFSRISAGYQHTCGLTTSGTVYCWGYNGYGQLGSGTNDNYSTVPVAVLPFGTSPLR